MLKYLYRGVVAMSLALAACSALVNAPTPVTTLTPKTAPQAIYEVKAGFNAALNVVVAYVHLPRCGQPGVGPICSDQQVINNVNNVAGVAWATMQGAEAIATDPKAMASDQSKAVASAQGALDTVTALTSKLKVQ